MVIDYPIKRGPQTSLARLACYQVSGHAVKGTLIHRDVPHDHGRGVDVDLFVIGRFILKHFGGHVSVGPCNAVVPQHHDAFRIWDWMSRDKEGEARGKGAKRAGEREEER